MMLCRRWILEGFFIFVLFIVAFFVSLSYSRSQHFAPLSQYQDSLEPAIYIACGKGFGGSPNSYPVVGKDFLSGKVDHFSCADMPVKQPISRTGIGVRDWYYLVGAIGIFWKITGISWSSIPYLVSFLASLSIGISYVIFRMGLNRVFSFLASLGFLFSTIHLTHLNNLRDYSPTPFVLAIILVLFIVVSKPLNNFRLFLLSALLGGLVGVGYGFRGDLPITLPIIFISLLFFLPENSLLKMPRNIGLVIVVLITFFATAYPVLETFKNEHTGNCLFHTAQQGLTEPFSQQLHVLPAFYDWGDQYSDSLAAGMGISHGMRNLKLTENDYCNYHYYLSTKDLYLSAVKTFPGDILTRLYGSVASIFKPHRLILAGIFILLLSIYHLRLALWVLVCVLYFYGYPAIQFGKRHYFYLTFWFLFLYAFFIYHIGKYFLAKKRAASLKDWNGYKKEAEAFIEAHGKRLLFFVVGVMLCLLTPLWAARYYQLHQVRKMVSAYENAEITPANLKSIQKEGNEYYPFEWTDPLQNLSADQYGGMKDGIGKILKIKIGGQTCKAKRLQVVLEYARNYEEFNFSRVFNVSLSSGSVSPYTFYIPLYFYKVGNWFGKPGGIRVTPENSNCIISIDFIQDPYFYPLWLTLQLPQELKQWRWYQTLRLIGHHTPVFQPSYD